MKKTVMKVVKRGIAVMTVLVLTSCGSTESETTNPKETEHTKQAEQTKQIEQKETSVTIENFDKTTVYESKPENVIVMSYASAEMLTALGVEDSILAIYENGNTVEDVLPEYREALKKVDKPETINAGMPTMENMLGLHGDMIISQSYFYNVEAFGTYEDYATNGINIYIPEGTYVLGSNMENVYADLRNYGKIFGVEEKAGDVIAQMQQQIQKVTAAVAGKEPVKVMVFDSEMGGAIYTSGGGSLENSLVTLAGGKNIFSDLKEQFTSITAEEIISRDPEFIVINDYGTVTAEEKIEYLKSRKELSDITAIKKDNFIVIPFFTTMPGMQNVSLVETLAERFYPDVMQ